MRVGRADGQDRSVGRGEDGVLRRGARSLRIAKELDEKERRNENGGRRPDRKCDGRQRRQDQGGNDEYPPVSGDRQSPAVAGSRYLRRIASIWSFRASFSFLSRFSSKSSSSLKCPFAARSW